MALAGLGAILAFAGTDTAVKSKASNNKAPAKSAKRTPKAAAKSGPNTAAARLTSKTPASTSKQSNTKSSPRQTAVRYQRSLQQQPTPERYREIQQALTEKGYFAGPVDGAWGADSVEALKRFQRDQNLTDDGKIGSLSLIALGLGPKREGSLPAPAADKTAP